jgi:hypothetical protein
LTVVFRMITARGADDGSGDRKPLVDTAGRPIEVLEGLVLRDTLPRVRDVGLARTDLDAAHRQVAEAFRAFWRSTGPFPPRTSQQVAISQDRPGERLPLTVAEPYVAPAPRSHEKEADDMPGPVHRSRGFGGAVVILVLIAAILGGIGGWIVRGGRPDSPKASTTTTTTPSHGVSATPDAETAAAAVGILCSAAQSGNVHALYTVMTNDYRRTTSEASLAAALLGTPAVPGTCGPINIEVPQPNAPEVGDITVATANSNRLLRVHLLPPAAGHGWQISDVTVDMPPQPACASPVTSASQAAPSITAIPGAATGSPGHC